MLELVRASRPAELRRALALATGMQLAAYQGAAVWAAEAEPSGPSQRDPNFTLGPVDAVWVPRVGALRSGPATAGTTYWATRSLPLRAWRLPASSVLRPIPGPKKGLIHPFTRPFIHLIHLGVGCCVDTSPPSDPAQHGRVPSVNQYQRKIFPLCHAPRKPLIVAVPQAAMSDEVSDFLRSVELLKERREEEDEARSRELEEKILQEKKERQARRAGTPICSHSRFRARSVLSHNNNNNNNNNTNNPRALFLFFTFLFFFSPPPLFYLFIFSATLANRQTALVGITSA